VPIEIRELHIRVSVTAAAGRPAGASGASAAGGADHEVVIAECVEQVLQVLRDQRER
jgi:hypothetical protein